MRVARLPLRARLVAGFVGAMLVVLVAAGAFVFWRVQYALDHRLSQDLASQTDDLRAAASRLAPAAAITSLGEQTRDGQLLSADGRILAAGPGRIARTALLTRAQARAASRGTARATRGNLFSDAGQHVRIQAGPVRGGGAAAAVAVTAIRLDQRDEALRELLAQLALANLLALALASAVGYRLARGALDPVERYRAQAEQIAAGATGVRLDVPPGPADEITRLGSTLNTMLDAQQRAATRQQQFIDDASHELRTPLSALSAEVDLALRKPRTAEEYELTLQRIAGDTAALVGLAEDLLTLGALGSSAPAAGQLGAASVLEAAARRARGQLGSRTVLVDAPTELSVFGDPALLDRALGNAVDNACRYGEGSLTLAAEQLDSRGAARLTVHDEGAGIPLAFLPHAAERFRQDERSRTGPGAGLGLALVDAIATAHHGQLRICAAGHHHRQPTVDAALQALPCTHPAAGTTISLLLPAAPVGA